MTFLSFDLELSDVFDLEPGQDLEAHAPLHVSVAATVVDGGEERLWYSEDAPGHPAVNLTAERAHDLLEYLAESQASGLQVFAWNGLKFDFKWLGHQAQDLELAARIARKSYDPFFQLFNQRGVFASLAKVAEGMGIPLRKSMAGAEAPRAWAGGRHREVMDYVLGDCRMTNLLVHALRERGELRWTTRKGSVATERFPLLKTVDLVIAEPGVAPTWMKDPPDKHDFFRWTETLRV